MGPVRPGGGRRAGRAVGPPGPAAAAFNRSPTHRYPRLPRMGPHAHPGRGVAPSAAGPGQCRRGHGRARSCRRRADAPAGAGGGVERHDLTRARARPPPSPPAQPTTVRDHRYVVRRYDSLWSIAEHHLGSGTRWREIRDETRKASRRRGRCRPGHPSGAGSAPPRRNRSRSPDRWGGADPATGARRRRPGSNPPFEPIEPDAAVRSSRPHRPGPTASPTPGAVEVSQARLRHTAPAPPAPPLRPPVHCSPPRPPRPPRPLGPPRLPL